MPADRIQLLNERVEALTEALVASDAVSRDWADSVQNTEQIGDGTEVAEAARAGRGPPDFADGPSNNAGDSNE